MKIKVSQLNIDNSKRGSPGNCPIARALKDLNLKDEHYVTIFDIRILRTGDKIELPYEASQFAIAFDKGEKVTPIEFDIDYSSRRD